VERIGRSVVGPSTGQSSTGAEGDPTASASPASGTRETPWVVGHTDSTCRKAGQYPGGRGGGSKRRPSGNRRAKATKGGGETHPERVLTSHRSSRKRKKKGKGTHGPHGRAASGTERPWLSTRNGESKAGAFGSSERPAIWQVNRLERPAGKLARAVLRGQGPGDRPLLPDRPLGAP
jgi:hypothetical protein